MKENFNHSNRQYRYEEYLGQMNFSNNKNSSQRYLTNNKDHYRTNFSNRSISQPLTEIRTNNVSRTIDNENLSVVSQRNQNHILKKEIKSLKNEIHRLKKIEAGWVFNSTQQDRLIQIEELNEKNQLLMKTIDRHIAQNQQLNILLEQQSLQIKDLQNQQIDRKVVTEQIINTKNAYEKKLQQIELSFQQKLDQKQNQIESFNRQVNQLKKNNSQLEYQISEYQYQLKGFKTDMQSKQNEIQNIYQKYKNQKIQYQQQEKQIYQLQTQLQKQQYQIQNNLANKNNMQKNKHENVTTLHEVTPKQKSQEMLSNQSSNQLLKNLTLISDYKKIDRLLNIENPQSLSQYSVKDLYQIFLWYKKQYQKQIQQIKSLQSKILTLESSQSDRRSTSRITNTNYENQKQYKKQKVQLEFLNLQLQIIEEEKNFLLQENQNLKKLFEKNINSCNNCSQQNNNQYFLELCMAKLEIQRLLSKLKKDNFTEQKFQNLIRSEFQKF